MNILNTFINIVQSDSITTTTIVVTLFTVTLLSLYEFAVYKLVSKKGIYNKAFNLVIVVVPYFIATIVLCLQSNMVITLGTIGALAIIRFRTAIKDPVDMVYLFWSIHNGIMVGCQLYKIAIITSIVVTLIVVIFAYGVLPFSKNRNYILALNVSLDSTKDIKEMLEVKYISKYEIVSRNCINEEMNYIIEIKSNKVDELEKYLMNEINIKKFSIFNSDGSSFL